MCLLHAVFSVYQPTPLAPPSEFWILPGLTISATVSLVQIVVSSHGLLCALFTSRPLFQLSKAKFFYCSYTALLNYKSLRANFNSKHLFTVHQEQSLALITTDFAPSLLFSSQYSHHPLYSIWPFCSSKHITSSKYTPISFGVIISIGYRIILRMYFVIL